MGRTAADAGRLGRHRAATRHRTGDRDDGTGVPGVRRPGIEPGLHGGAAATRRLGGLSLVAAIVLPPESRPRGHRNPGRAVATDRSLSTRQEDEARPNPAVAAR